MHKSYRVQDNDSLEPALFSLIRHDLAVSTEFVPPDRTTLDA